MESLTQCTWVWVTPGAGDGQGSLACCSPWGPDSQTQLNDWTELNYLSSVGRYTEDLIIYSL